MNTTTTTLNTLALVEEFHTTYQCVLKHSPDISDQSLNDARVAFIQEELDELKEALANNDMVEVLDALIDLQYFLDGTFLAFGVQKYKDAAFLEVHRSNMSKLGEDGQPIFRESDGKVMKGPNYFKPDLKRVLEDTKQAA